MNKVIQGVIHGNTIELSENLGLADGQSVQVVVQAAEPPRPWGDGIRKSAGGPGGLMERRGRQDPRGDLPGSQKVYDLRPRQLTSSPNSKA